MFRVSSGLSNQHAQPQSCISLLRHSARSKLDRNSEITSNDGTDDKSVRPASTMGQGTNVGHMRSREVGNGLPRRPSSPRESARVARIRDVMWDWEVRTRHAGHIRPGTSHSESEDGAETSLGFYELVAAERDDGKSGTKLQQQNIRNICMLSLCLAP